MSALLHAKQRARERYGASLSGRDFRAMAHLIRDGRSTPVRRSSLSRSVHWVFYRDRDWLVVYSRQSKGIVTVLDPERG